MRAVEPHWLRSRRVYAYPTPVPPSVAVITVSSDNQRGAEIEEKRARTGRVARSEVQVVGRGADSRCAVLAHIVIPHAPFTPESNEMKLRIANTPFHLADGSYLMPAGGADDISDGATIDRAIQSVSSPECI